MLTASPPKPSSLSARLQADQEQTQRQLADQTQTLLTQHVSGLKKLLSVELRSIKSVSERHRVELDQLHQGTLTRIRWLLLWPVAATVLMSLAVLIAVAIWTSYRLDQISDAQAALDQSSVNLAAQQQAQQATQHQVQQVPPLRKRR